MIKLSIQQEDMAIINQYEPKYRDSKYIKQKLTELKGERSINNNWILHYPNFNTGYNN